MKIAIATLVSTLSICLLADQPAVADELTIGLASEPTSMDPHYHNLGPNVMLSFHIFDRLIDLDENQNQRPGLAESWRAIDDTTWEINLRRDVTFHDGNPFNADDVIFTMQRIPGVEGPSGFGSYVSGKTVSKVDDYTIRIETEKPAPLVPNDLSTFGIVSEEAGRNARKSDYETGVATVGSGPFKFVEFVPNERIVLIRNEDYWGEPPIWDRVVFKPIESAPSRVAALIAGDVDLIDGVPTADIEALKQRPEVAVWQGPSNRLMYLHLDQDRVDSPFVKANGGGEIENPLRSLAVRTAITTAIDRDAIVENVMEGMAIKAGQLVPDGFFGASDKLRPVNHDRELAKALLDEAGLTDGFELRIHGPNDRYVNDAKIVEAVAQMLTKVGIKTDVETMPRSVYFSRASRGGPNETPEFSLVLVGWSADSGEASSPLRQLVHTYDEEAKLGTFNRGRYSNPEVDRLINEALATVDDVRRQELLAEATEIAIEEVAVIPLHFQMATWATRSDLRYKTRIDENTLAVGVIKE